MFWMFPDRELPDAYEQTLPEVFPDFAPATSASPRDRQVGLDQLQQLPVGPQLVQPAGPWRWPTCSSTWPTAASRCCGWTRSGLSGSGSAPAARTSPRSTTCCWPCGLRPHRRPGGDLQGRGDRQPHRPRRLPGRRPPPRAHLRPGLPQQPDGAVLVGGGDRDARLATLVLDRLPAKPASTAWATYLRCHDDIGWAVLDEDAAALGWSGFAHRRFLADFYAGKFPGSFARGEVFQDNPTTGDRRTSGTMASLAGLEDALAAGDPDLVDLAIRRILLGHALVFGYDGIPLLYMGDELGMLNDHSYLDDLALAADNRWLHRPRWTGSWPPAAPSRAPSPSASSPAWPPWPRPAAAPPAARRHPGRGGRPPAAAAVGVPAVTRSAP